jgi:hypothetical protein
MAGTSAPFVYAADNVTTLVSDNFTISLSPDTLTTLATIANDAAQILADNLKEVISDILGLMIVVFIGLLAFWHRDSRIYILAGFSFLLYGFGYYRTSVYISVILALLGIFCFAKAAWDRKKVPK